uniref:Uncharacterized protein n=1 Tax=Tanacetum cinerariifolium TaxID=118510 RepID=A0A6L2KPZ1_TANCI|nr:hypothetical protein [Tanacetum cinerariifolium]
MSSSSTSTQNMAFVSSSNNNNTNGSVNTALGVSTSGTQVNTVNIDNLSDVVIYTFLASQPSSPQLINEDLEQIHLDNFEECHRLLTNQVNLVNLEGHWLVPDVRKPLPLGVRSHMRILSVISIKTFERYRHAFQREVVIRSANYNEYKIFEADFKNLHPNDFEDLLYQYNPGMEYRMWSEDDKRRSEDFMEVIERRLKIRRIFRSLESFVGGRLRDVDYMTLNRT